MSNAFADSTHVGTTGKPNPFALLFHIGKTSALVGSVLQDGRVSWLPKTVFLTCISALLAAIILPELGIDTGIFFALPGVGAVLDALGLPVDATFDWVAFTVAAFNLLRLFPTEIVGEHYDRLFRRR
ncbi:MAG TPA: hypothetical protein VF116_08280 [Ktedonobacterales bacterium]